MKRDFVQPVHDAICGHLDENNVVADRFDDQTSSVCVLARSELSTVSGRNATGQLDDETDEIVLTPIDPELRLIIRRLRCVHRSANSKQLYRSPYRMNCNASIIGIADDIIQLGGLRVASAWYRTTIRVPTCVGDIDAPAARHVARVQS
ncbi:hypothetical protein [Burkholderia metallica]|uniref:hypothetical protein n=1 Tax=Burkholderia metallica TaxID=488729 RepID=UPI001CF2D43A|nr:hypothetical protein [Burkholderia metallica]MCA8023442.1 hypothetical protein [Burkholderia metallica]